MRAILIALFCVFFAVSGLQASDSYDDGYDDGTSGEPEWSDNPDYEDGYEDGKRMRKNREEKSED